MRLEIEDIYSPEGRRVLAEAFTKSFWADKIYHRAFWNDVPILQTPEDMLMISELIFRLQPELVVECGIWKGGGLLFYASILELIGKGEVIGVDVNISRALHVKRHKLGKRVSLIQSSSSDVGVRKMLSKRTKGQVLVILDSDHSAKHVRAELENLAPLVKRGGYLVVLDGVMGMLHDVPDGKAEWLNDNPEVAIKDFLAVHTEFKRDLDCNKFGVTYGPGGYLKRD